MHHCFAMIDHGYATMHQGDYKNLYPSKVTNQIQYFNQTYSITSFRKKKRSTKFVQKPILIGIFDASQMIAVLTLFLYITIAKLCY